MTDSPASLPITKLRETYRERLIIPGDPTYDEARVVFYGGIDNRPAAIIQVVNATEVAQVIALAKETGLELAIRSGGHSFAGHSTTEGGIVLDLRRMRDLQVDAATQTAWVEPGLTAGEYSVEIGKQNFVTGFGDTGSVGIGGITLNGGVGFLVRKFGLAIDNLLAAEIVTADGQLLRIDTQNYPDLFWAIRGGGGNFGVVTRFLFQLRPLADAYGGMLILPAEPGVIANFIQLAKQAPEEVSTILNVMPAPPMPFLPAEHHGKLVAMALMMYAGPAAAGEQALAPFRALATPLADQLKPMKYSDMFPPEDESYRPTAVARTMFMSNVDLPLAQTILDQLNVSDSPMRVVQLRVLGGAMARVSVDSTAFAHRNSPIMANVAAFYTGEEEKVKRQAWLQQLVQILNQGENGAYVGFLGPDELDRVQDAYPASTWQKLVEIKRRYDPQNLFRLNVNISPE